LNSGRLLSGWRPPLLEQQQRSWQGAVIANTPGVLSMCEAMYYSLTLPVSTVIVGCDSVEQLEQNVQLARESTPLSAQQMAGLAERARRFQSNVVLPICQPRISDVTD